MARAERSKAGAATVRGTSVYVALLRGINVGGHAPVKMDALRAAFEAMGFGRVTSYLQSGNMVFASPERKADGLAALIERRLAADFGVAVAVLVKTAARLAEVVAQNPFLAEAGIDPATLHVTFLFGSPEPAGMRKLDALDAAGDRFRRVGDVLFLHCPNGYGRSKLANPALERVLAVRATTRNWRTVNALCRLAEV